MGSPAQPFIDMKNKLAEWANKAEEWDKPIGKKQDSTGWTPEPNEEQKKAIEDRNAETKPLSQRKLGGKNRPAIKKPAATNQTQRKQP